MAEQRIKIIPDRIFHKLWDGASDYSNVHDYVDAFTQSLSKRKVDFHKYKIEYDLACMILKSIYDMQKKSLSILINENNIKPIDLSHRFCIPIRTLENWMSDKRTPPDYLKLFIIEAYDIRFLPNFVYTESLNKQRGRYVEEKNIISKESSVLVDKSDSIFIDKNFDDVDDFDFDKIDKRMREFETRYNSKQTAKSLDILDKTSYLDSIIKKK